MYILLPFVFQFLFCFEVFFCGRMAQKNELFIRRTSILGADIVNCYAHFLRRFPYPCVVSLSDFTVFYNDEHMEYIFYCGVCPGQFVADDLIEDIFSLVCAYLYFPHCCENESLRTFCLLMLYYLWFTQPFVNFLEGPTLRVNIPIARGVMNRLLSSMNARQSTDEGRCLKFSSDMFEQCERSSSMAEQRESFLSLAEVQAVLTLHKFNAWDVVPFFDIGPYVMVLCDVHDVLKVPLNIGSVSSGRIERYGFNLSGAMGDLRAVHGVHSELECGGYRRSGGAGSGDNWTNKRRALMNDIAEYRRMLQVIVSSDQ